jgi:penicillin-insensitive murein endopeptidase
MRWALSASVGVAAMTVVALAASADPELPPAFKKSPWTLRALSVGQPQSGSLVRGTRLRASTSVRMWKGGTAPAFATPQLVKAIERAASKVKRAHGGSTLVVFALSNEKGGPLKEHRSHQSGRDADLVFYAVDARGKPATSKKLAHFGGDGVAKEGLKEKALRFDDERNWALVDALANDRDGRVTHIFVDAKLRNRLLAFARKASIDEARIAKVTAVLFVGDDSEPLDAYFHVRVACPEGQGEICKG